MRSRQNSKLAIIIIREENVRIRLSGYTLVELLVALAIGAILLMIAIPGYSYLVHKNTLTVVTNDLVTALHLARSEAIKRSMRVTICKTSNATNTAPACDPLASWRQGWLVFVDGGTAGVFEFGDTILWVQDSASRVVTITTSNFNNYVSYLASGKSQGPNGLANGAILVCVNGERRDIIINNTGRIRLSTNIC